MFNFVSILLKEILLSLAFTIILSSYICCTRYNNIYNKSNDKRLPYVSVCNVTIKADMLLARSNSTFGQIKSPALSGPNYCWYTLDPGLDRRVELQVYRLVNAGHFNGSRQVTYTQLRPTRNRLSVCR